MKNSIWYISMLRLLHKNLIVLGIKRREYKKKSVLYWDGKIFEPISHWQTWYHWKHCIRFYFYERTMDITILRMSVHLLFRSVCFYFKCPKFGKETGCSWYPQRALVSVIPRFFFENALDEILLALPALKKQVLANRSNGG